ncbi:pseudouridine synthase [Clostridia bacterium]|nr:pseudouridine synthase [Clostridia bacterium]
MYNNQNHRKTKSPRKDIFLTVDSETELLPFLYEKLAGEKSGKYPGTLPRKTVKTLLTNRCITVNGKVRTKYNYALHTGNEVVADFAGKTDFLEKAGVRIIYEDKELLIINKPAGLLTVADGKLDCPTVYTVMNKYLHFTDEKAKANIVHRLDRDTSGVLLMTKTFELKKSFQEKWSELTGKRLYYAIVAGQPKRRQDTITSYLDQTGDKKGMVFSRSFNPEAVQDKAVTEYTVIKQSEEYSLLDVSITTGKKNQIRVALRDIGHPILGDRKYGGKNYPRLCLHAYELEITHPVSGKVLNFRAPTPGVFEQLF